jgi:hypothetical protein
MTEKAKKEANRPLSPETSNNETDIEDKIYD